jgi:hypothetical protein
VPQGQGQTGPDAGWIRGSKRCTFKLLYLGGLGNYVVTMIETLKMCFDVVNTFMQKDQNKFEVLYLMI